MSLPLLYSYYLYYISNWFAYMSNALKTLVLSNYAIKVKSECMCFYIFHIRIGAGVPELNWRVYFVYSSQQQY